MKITNVFTCLLISVAALTLYGCGATTTGLTKAISEGNRAAAIKSIQGGANVREIDGLGNSPLKLAIKKNDPELVSLILDKGAVVDNAGLICKAIESGKDNINNSLKIVKYLIKHGASTDKASCMVQVEFPDKHAPVKITATPLALAVTTSTFASSKDNSIVDYLLSRKNGLDKSALPLTFFAAKSKNWDLVKELYRDKISLDGALYGVIILNNENKAIEYLKLGAHPNNNSMNMMKYALYHKNINVMIALLDNGYDISSYKFGAKGVYGEDQAILIDVVRTGDYDLIRKFLLLGSDPNKNGRSTSLCMAISLTKFGKMSVDEGLNITNLLIASGADVNLPCDTIQSNLNQLHTNETPLNTSIYTFAKSSERMYPITKALLVAGAKPNVSSGTLDRNPLLNANDVKTIELLIAMEADVNLAHGALKNTALHKAADSGDIKLAKIFLNAGANPNLKNHEKLTAADVAKSRCPRFRDKHSCSEVYSMIRDHGGRIYGEKKGGSGNSLSFGKLFATVAIASMTGNANISADKKAEIMSATVNDIWIKDGKGTQLAEMYKSGSSGSSGNPLLDDLMNTKREQQSVSDMYRKEMKKYQATIRQQREKRKQKPSLYQQQLNRIAGQTKNNTSSGKLANNRTVRIQPNKNTSLNSKKRNTSVASNTAKYRAPQASSSSSTVKACSQYKKFKGDRVLPQVHSARAKVKEKITSEWAVREHVWGEAKNDARKTCRGITGKGNYGMIGSKADASCTKLASKTWECSIAVEYYCDCVSTHSGSVR